MEWLNFFKIFWAISVLVILVVTLLAVWRMKGIFSWQKSLKAELAELKIKAGKDGGPLEDGVQVIQETCGRVFKSAAPEISELGDIPLYIRSIATCFHPQSDHPELQIRISALVRGLERSLGQFDRILERPGFKKLKTVNLRQIRKLHQRYRRLCEFYPYRWILNHKKMMQRISQAHLLLLFDPLLLLVHLSRRLTVLMLFKYLMVDLYLFVGKLTLEACGDTEICTQGEGETELEETIEALDAIQDNDERQMDPRIEDIRNQLVGFPSVLISNPTLAMWQKAVFDAALIISKKHFPESDHPLEEAAIGPLLESARVWAGKIGQGQEHLLMRHLYNMRLETLYKAKNLSNGVLPKTIQNFIKTCYKTYGWLKWPLKTYRLVKKTTPWRITLEVGWTVSKKVGLAYIHGKAFDTACKELERVYCRSSTLKLLPHKIPLMLDSRHHDAE